MALGIKFAELLYRPIYDRLGVDATLVLNGVIYPPPGSNLVALDKTEGIEIVMGMGIGLETMKPICEFIIGDLLALGITPNMLDDGSVTLNSRNWKILSHRLNPTTSGTSDGTVYCQLEGLSDDG